MGNNDSTNGGIRVEIGSNPVSEPSNSGVPIVFPIPNKNREGVKTLEDLA